MIFWDIVSRHVHVSRSDLVGITSSSILLKNGNEIPMDVLFAGTGWDTRYKFLTLQQVYEFGLPHDVADKLKHNIEYWKRLTDEADQQIL